LEKQALEHSSFPQPVNGDTKIWRYLSLSKFLDFYLSQSLYFSRVDLLEDKCEGTYTKINTNRFPFGEVKIPSGQVYTQEEYTKRLRQANHVNCWRLDNHESEAMWKVYCPDNNGLAIQTTYNKLVSSLPDQKGLFIGLVTYLNYETETFSEWNHFNPIMHKRIAFEHEKEVRIVTSHGGYMNDHKLPLPSPGIKIQTSLLKNLENIYVNPYAEEWYFETIEKLFKHLDINTSLKWSEIKAIVRY